MVILKRFSIHNAKFPIGLAVISLLIFSCTNETKPPEAADKRPAVTENKISAPEFNADSAYLFTKQQVGFGPRVPGTRAHAKCAEYLVNKLKGYKLEVMVQTGTIQTFDSKQFKLKNIIASYKPELRDRILLCAHWDARPFADEDTKDKDKPIDAASDGAAGVAVLLEFARHLDQVPPKTGVDIILFDLEDYGSSGDANSWCLGSQYWSHNPHKPDYTAKFGILLDMVGAANATFPKESHSVEYASSFVDQVWNTASNLGFSNYFLNETINFVGVDDHIWVNKAGVPCIDIIQYDKNNGGFASYHHTHEDNMSLIDKNTLKAVGQTLLEVIYQQ
jgi:glutaminyl-peptide cyclotransferase